MRLHDPLSPDDRFHEIAEILVRGIHRLHSLPAPDPDSAPAESTQSCQNGLEVGGDPRLSGHGG
jgi:hypothetical protein